MNRSVSLVVLSVASLFATRAEAAPVCGEGFVYYFDQVCMPDGQWELRQVGFEHFGRIRSLYLVGTRSDCVVSERVVGGGGTDRTQCEWNSFDIAPLAADCQIPANEVCEPHFPEPQPEPDPEPIIVQVDWADAPWTMDPKAAPIYLDASEYGWPTQNGSTLTP